jgi:Uma2 family endonuclease
MIRMYDTVEMRDTGGCSVAISLNLAEAPTDDQILNLSRRNPGLQFERSAAGELIVTPTGSSSGRRELLLGTQLQLWAHAEGSGLAFGPGAGFRLPDGSLFAPDASWIRRDRWDALTREQQEGFAPLCPDAVFEIVSPADSLRDLRRKMRAYLANGCGLAVLVDPDRQAAELFIPGREPQVIEPARTISLAPVLPGFVLDLETVFE